MLLYSRRSSRRRTCSPRGFESPIVFTSLLSLPPWIQGRKVLSTSLPYPLYFQTCLRTCVHERLRYAFATYPYTEHKNAELRRSIVEDVCWTIRTQTQSGKLRKERKRWKENRAATRKIRKYPLGIVVHSMGSISHWYFRSAHPVSHAHGALPYPQQTLVLCWKKKNDWKVAAPTHPDPAA